MKKLIAISSALALGLAVAACDGPAENAAEDAGEANAEAVNEQTGPSQDVLNKLNLVRQRAGLAALTTASPQAATKQTMRNEIERQRRLEFAFEGERWWEDALGGEVEERRLRGLGCMQALRKGVEEARTI